MPSNEGGGEFNSSGAWTFFVVRLCAFVFPLLAGSAMRRVSSFSFFLALESKERERELAHRDFELQYFVLFTSSLYSQTYPCGDFVCLFVSHRFIDILG